jgi:hypothetical protein
MIRGMARSSAACLPLDLHGLRERPLGWVELGGWRLADALCFWISAMASVWDRVWISSVVPSCQYVVYYTISHVEANATRNAYGESLRRRDNIADSDQVA